MRGAPPSARRDTSRRAGQADERVSVRRGGSAAPTYPPRPRSRLHAIAPPRRGPLRGSAPSLPTCAWLA